MEDRSLFISSLTRRQMARRRPGRSLVRAQLVLALMAVAIALGAFVLAHGGL
jgi:hypothetical protein